MKSCGNFLQLFSFDCKLNKRFYAFAVLSMNSKLPKTTFPVFHKTSTGWAHKAFTPERIIYNADVFITGISFRAKIWPLKLQSSWQEIGNGIERILFFRNTFSNPAQWNRGDTQYISNIFVWHSVYNIGEVFKILLVSLFRGKKNKRVYSLKSLL